jgi:hypothetical protein
MQFSLKWLLAATAYVALLLVALLNANSVWQGIFQSAAATLLLVALTGAIVCVGKAKCFWIGYVIFGLVFFVGATGLVPNIEKSGILPSALFSYAHGKMFERTPAKLTAADVEELSKSSEVHLLKPLPDGTVNAIVLRPSERRFVNVGNIALCIPFGLLGGLVATAFYRRRPRQTAQAAAQS